MKLASFARRDEIEMVCGPKTVLRMQIKTIGELQV